MSADYYNDNGDNEHDNVYDADIDGATDISGHHSVVVVVHYDAPT